MSGDNTWWAKNNNGGVVAHTPDETQYHYPDNSQTSHMRGGIGAGVIIPRANDDGTSKGFDGRVAGTVHVDPEAPDGGTIVDLTQLSQGKLREAFRQSEMPHQVYYALGQSPHAFKQNQSRSMAQAPVSSTPRSNPHVPTGTYVVPSSSADGTQQFNQAFQEIRPVTPVPPLQRQSDAAPAYTPAPVTEARPVVSPAPYSPPQQYAPQPTQEYVPQQPQWGQQPPQYAPAPTPPGQYDQVMQQIGQLSHVVSGLANQLGQMQNAQWNQVAAQPIVPPQPVQQAPQPQLNTAPRATVPKLRTGERAQPLVLGGANDQADDEVSNEPQTLAKQDAAREGIVVGFETLGLPFIKGPFGEKARKSVYFDIPGAGTMAAKYHAVIESPDCLILVYDSRYEEGTQYVPPALGETPIAVQLFQGKNKENKKFSCTSPGLAFSLGVLDIVLLLLQPDSVNPNNKMLDEDDDEE